MRLLLLSPPAIPAYVNLDYQFVELGEVAEYLRSIPDVQLHVADFGLGDGTWGDISDLLFERPAILILHNTIENFPAIERAVAIAGAVSPDTAIATYGRLSAHVSEPFKQLALDLIVVRQDWEESLRVWIEHLCRSDKRGSSAVVPGAWVRGSEGWIVNREEPRIDGDWAVPALDLLPLDAYRTCLERMSAGRKNAKPFELGIGISRGCDDYCGYCPIPDVAGRVERFRKDLTAVARLMPEARERGFNRLSLFAANFTRHRDFVSEFNRVVGHPSGLPWGCVTSPALLDSELIASMAGAGCDRIAVGVESLRVDGRNQFSWRIGAADLIGLARVCRASGVGLVAFIMVGVPSQTRRDVIFTLNVCRDNGVTPRPMIYRSFKKLSTLEQAEDPFWLNRTLLPSGSSTREFSARDLVGLVRDWERWLDSV